LPVLDQEGLRPTSERIRETVFNWLSPVIEGSRCLDLFAGTGALGVEALSRGAAEVVFVERSDRAARQIVHGLEALAAEGAGIETRDALDYLKSEAPASFDIVFLDPPFAADYYAELCRLLSDRGWVSSGSWVYLEQDRTESVPELPPSWEVVKEKTAGQVRYSLIRVQE
jgi:16S rRNA (guanine966-N2)-methyltransferase